MFTCLFSRGDSLARAPAHPHSFAGPRPLKVEAHRGTEGLYLSGPQGHPYAWPLSHLSQAHAPLAPPELLKGKSPSPGALLLQHGSGGALLGTLGFREQPEPANPLIVPSVCAVDAYMAVVCAPPVPGAGMWQLRAHCPTEAHLQPKNECHRSPRPEPRHSPRALLLGQLCLRSLPCKWGQQGW